MEKETIAENIKTITKLAEDLLSQEEIEKLKADLINGAERFFNKQAKRKLDELSNLVYNNSRR